MNLQVQIRDFNLYNNGQPFACRIKNEYLPGTFGSFRDVTLYLKAVTQIGFEDYALAGADEYTQQLLFSKSLGFISSSSVEPLPNLRIEDVVVVSNYFDYQPGSGLAIPYILDSHSTEQICSVFHKAVCDNWRWFNTACADPTLPMHGPRFGRLNIPEQVPALYLTAAQRDELACKDLNSITFLPGWGFAIRGCNLWSGGACRKPIFPETRATAFSNSLVTATLNAMRYHNVDLTYPTQGDSK